MLWSLLKTKPLLIAVINRRLICWPESFGMHLANKRVQGKEGVNGCEQFSYKM